MWVDISAKKYSEKGLKNCSEYNMHGRPQNAHDNMSVITLSIILMAAST